MTRRGREQSLIQEKLKRNSRARVSADRIFMLASCQQEKLHVIVCALIVCAYRQKESPIEITRRRFVQGALVACGVTRGPLTVRHRVRVRDFGARGDGVNDDTNAIQTAHDHVAAQGGGIVQLGTGHFRTSRPLRWASGVSLVGDGSSSSWLRPVVVAGAAITAAAPFTRTAPLRDATFARFGIDGRGMHEGRYSSDQKGIFFRHLANVTFRDVAINDTPATGLGVDFLRDVVITRVATLRCGRRYQPGAGGGAGIGIGTGASSVERVTLRDCRTDGSGSHGILFEHQPGTPYLPTGVRVIGCSSSDNAGHGIMDSGCRGMLVHGCRSQRNRGSGFACNASDLGMPGRGGVVRHNTFVENGARGVVLAATRQTAASDYRVAANAIRDNGGAGIELMGLRATIVDCQVLRNLIAGNGTEGIRVTGFAAEGLTMQYNHIDRNGQRVHEPGINITADVDDLRIEHNTFLDRQARATQGAAIVVGPGVRIRGGVVDSNDTRRNPGGGLRIDGHMEPLRG